MVPFLNHTRLTIASHVLGAIHLDCPCKMHCWNEKWMTPKCRWPNNIWVTDKTRLLGGQVVKPHQRCLVWLSIARYNHSGACSKVFWKCIGQISPLKKPWTFLLGYSLTGTVFECGSHFSLKTPSKSSAIVDALYVMYFKKWGWYVHRKSFVLIYHMSKTKSMWARNWSSKFLASVSKLSHTDRNWK